MGRSLVRHVSLLTRACEMANDGDEEFVSPGTTKNE